MNEIIKDVLEERAGHARTPHVDAAQLIRSGRRRRTARRGVGVVAVAAVAASTVVVAPTIVERVSGDGAQANPAPDLDVAWADADFIYYGDHRTPRPAGYFDLSSHEDSVLYSTGRGEIYEWRPSEGGDPALIVDDAVGTPEVEGNLAAWLEADGPDQLRIVMKAGDTEYRSAPLPATKDGPSIGALDDSGTPTVIYSSGRHVWSWNGSDRPIQLDIGRDNFIDRANGVTATRGGFSGDDTWTVRFLDSAGSEISQVQGVWSDGLLDDSGNRYLTQTGRFPGTPAVIDVASGRSTPLEVGRSNRGLQMTWDVDGNVTLAIRPRAQDDAPVDLMTCTPTDGECAVIAEGVGDFSDVILAGETYAGL